MLGRIRERIANEVRQGGGGNPFQLNFNDNNNNGQQPPAGAGNQAADQHQHQQADNPQPLLVRPDDLYLGCSTRVRRELQRINDWDRRIALKDVWTQAVTEAPTREDLEDLQQRGQGVGVAVPAQDANNPNNNNPNADPMLLQLLNANREASAGNENTDHDIREIMDLNIKKQRFRPAFYKVQFFNPTYANNLELMKLFFRRHAGNPKLAAQQFCRYWDLKLDYFGLEQLCQPLSLKNSLSSQDKACLHNGCMQLTRDEHGRTVLLLLPSLVTVEQANGPKKTASMEVDGEDMPEEEESSKLVCPHLVRALWYLVFRALQDKGETTLIICLLGQDKDDLFGKTILHCTSVLREALPFHVVALHYLDGPGMSTLEEDSHNTNHHQTRNPMNDHFLWAQDNNNNNNNHQDLPQFGGAGLEQVAEWGGAVQLPAEEEELPDHNGPLLPGAPQDAEQQQRMLDSSKSSLEHLEDRVGRNVRLRVRFHNLFQLQLEALARNLPEEDEGKEDPFWVLRKRMTLFGIPNLPLNSDGTLIMNNPIDASSKRFFFTRPEASLSKNLILPKLTDILLGKGRPYQEHIGNIALNDIIDQHRAAYTSCKSRSEKTAMSQSILEKIQQQGGRFLIKKSRDDDLWIIAPQAKARDKIAHSFRLPRKHLKEAMEKAKKKEQAEAQAAAGGVGATSTTTANPSQPQPPQEQAPSAPPNGQPTGGVDDCLASV